MSITSVRASVNARASPPPPAEAPSPCPQCCDRRIWRLNAWGTSYVPVCVWCDATDLASDHDLEPTPPSSSAKGL